MKIPARNDQSINEFWAFCREREQIYFMKEDGVARPWTTDPVLRDYFFCNAKRTWDTGTKYILPTLEELELKDYLFHVLLYRTFNLIATHRAIVAAHRDSWVDTAQQFDVDLAIHVVKQRQDNGLKAFTGAFMTAGIVNAAKNFSAKADGVEAVLRYVDGLRTQWVPGATALFNRRDISLESIYETFLQLDGFGRFLSYQVALDTAYWFPLDLDTFTVMGPGAEAGLRRIYPTMGGSQEEMLACIRNLATTQPPDMPSYLHLCDIEHSLCESLKYFRVKSGAGSTRKYTPGVAR